MVPHLNGLAFLGGKGGTVVWGEGKKKCFPFAKLSQSMSGCDAESPAAEVPKSPSSSKSPVVAVYPSSYSSVSPNTPPAAEYNSGGCGGDAVEHRGHPPIISVGKPATTDQIIQKRKALDCERRALQEEKSHLHARDLELQMQYEKLHKYCTHPSEHVNIDYETGPYGGKSYICALCGWEDYKG